MSNNTETLNSLNAANNQIEISQILETYTSTSAKISLLSDAAKNGTKSSISIIIKNLFSNSLLFSEIDSNQLLIDAINNNNFDVAHYIFARDYKNLLDENSPMDWLIHVASCNNLRLKHFVMLKAEKSILMTSNPIPDQILSHIKSGKEIDDIKIDSQNTPTSSIVKLILLAIENKLTKTIVILSKLLENKNQKKKYIAYNLITLEKDQVDIIINIYSYLKQIDDIAINLNRDSRYSLNLEKFTKIPKVLLELPLAENGNQHLINIAIKNDNFTAISQLKNINIDSSKIKINPSLSKYKEMVESTLSHYIASRPRV